MRLLLCGLFLLSLRAQDFAIQPESSVVEAVIEKTGLLSGKKHILRWRTFSGRFSVQPPRVNLTVDAASAEVLDTWIGPDKRKDVLAEAIGKNGLDASGHPAIRFVSTSVSGNVEGEFQVAGNLTVRGVTRPVTLQVRQVSAGRYEGSTVFSMSGFGIKPPKAALGTIGTRDQMLIRFTVSGTAP